MKKFLLALTVGALISQPALAQNIQNYASVCININSLAELVSEFDEAPSLTMTSIREGRNGELVQIPTVLFINYETKTWSLVERVERNRFCVVATGEDITPYVKK